MLNVIVSNPHKKKGCNLVCRNNGGKMSYSVEK